LRFINHHLRRRLELGVVVRFLLRVPGERAVGARVREVGHSVVAHALRELQQFLDRLRTLNAVLAATRQQVATPLRRCLDLGVITLELLVSGARPPVRVRVRIVGQTVVSHALRERPGGFQLVAHLAVGALATSG
jgi:hypothetical protein